VIRMAVQKRKGRDIEIIEARE